MMPGLSKKHRRRYYHSNSVVETLEMLGVGEEARAYDEVDVWFEVCEEMWVMSSASKVSTGMRSI
jgi:hypothetical protein